MVCCVVLSIISLNTIEVEYIFICLWTIQVYPVVNCLFISLEHFLLEVVFFLLISNNSLCILSGYYSLCFEKSNFV